MVLGLNTGFSRRIRRFALSVGAAGDVQPNEVLRFLGHGLIAARLPACLRCRAR